VTIAIIPARGGSKRIPRKNVRDFCGRPMIEWSIVRARESGCFSRIVVSTDDEEIAAVAVAAGAEVPFLRPADLADDYTGTVPVVRHAIETLILEGCAPAFVCCIYATAPFLRVDELRKGLDFLRSPGAVFAYSVTTYAFPIERALRIRDDGLLEMMNPGNAAMRSQDLEERFHDAGQFYWGRTSAWMSGLPVLSSPAVPVVLPRYRVQDIDTPDDWVRAELMFSALSLQISGKK
jgi:pseudaminic acid cytidylyltransferase